MKGGHWRETPVDVSGHDGVWREALSGKQTGLIFRAGGGGGRGGASKRCIDHIQPPPTGGKSHHVTVGRLQVAVAPRLRLVDGGRSQRAFIALLVQAVYGIPDVGRSARPL